MPAWLPVSSMPLVSQVPIYYTFLFWVLSVPLIPTIVPVHRYHRRLVYPVSTFIDTHVLLLFLFHKCQSKCCDSTVPPIRLVHSLYPWSYPIHPSLTNYHLKGLINFILTLWCLIFFLLYVFIYVFSYVNGVCFHILIVVLPYINYNLCLLLSLLQYFPCRHSLLQLFHSIF